MGWSYLAGQVRLRSVGLHYVSHCSPPIDFMTKLALSQRCHAGLSRCRGGLAFVQPTGNVGRVEAYVTPDSNGRWPLPLVPPPINRRDWDLEKLCEFFDAQQTSWTRYTFH
jgi:hypothetical protein